MSGQSLSFIKSSGRPRDYSDAVGTVTHQAGSVSMINSFVYWWLIFGPFHENCACNITSYTHTHTHTHIYIFNVYSV